ncbi:MAG: hypothetical protein HY859_02375 [Caulobacterales bacterium]|nr:hypothetical protein [Caulobacterales bacterium]
MRFWTPLAFAAVITLPGALALALPAQAAEKPLTRDALLTVLKADQVWCSGWRAQDQSCEDVAFVDVLPGNKVRQVSRYRMSSDPDLQMVVRETVDVEGGALCSTFRFTDLDIVVLMDNEPAPQEQAAGILAVLAQSMANLEGKKTCEAYVRDEATGELKSTVTLDGEAAPEFDSIYRLIAPDTRILLRPMFEGEEQSTAV